MGCFLVCHKIKGGDALTKNKVIVNGYIRAVADVSHPLQTKLSLILTDFLPNGNKQGIPETEKQNILATAMNQPIKINFDGVDYGGHTGAIPLGPITRVFESVDGDRPIIAAEGVIWADLYEPIADHLKVAFSEGVGTSWEIYYEDSTVDASGTEWLHGCVFGGTCVVKVPAYGPTRTRILAIAEHLHKNELEINDNIMAGNVANSETEVETLRTDLSNVSDLLFQLWDGVDALFSKTFEIEAQTVEKDIGAIAASFAEKLGKIADRINEMSTKLGLSEETNQQLTTDLASVQAELTQIKEAQAQKEKEAAAEQLRQARKAQLDTVSISIDTNPDFYLTMSEEAFTQYVADLTTVARGKRSESSLGSSGTIPEPLSTNNQLTNQDLAAAINKETRGK